MNAADMARRARGLLVLVVALGAAAALCGCDGGTGAGGGLTYRPRLLLSLPETCNTPDGMTLDEETGDVYLSCPNFNDPNFPGVLMKITPSNKLEKFFDLPAHAETGKVGPMGLDIGPDGHIYVADNQYFEDKDHKSRLLRVRMEEGQPVGCDVAVDGFKLSNAVIWRGNYVYVSDTHFDLEDKPGMSGVYRFSLDEMNQGPVKLKPKGEADPHLIATFQAIPGRGNSIAGADGLTFDSQGNLYTGNFGDGVFYKITFDEAGNVTSNQAHLLHPRLRCVDGIFCDTKTDRIYIADSADNAIKIVEPDGNLTTLWENDDTDGSDGLLDQPCEVLLRGNEVLVVNMDMPFPGLKNTAYDDAHTISVIRLSWVPSWMQWKK